MFEKIGRLAETAATKVSVSRRGFLGRLGQGALVMTGVLSGMLAIPRDARAGGSYVCCKYSCSNFPYKSRTIFRGCYPAGTICPYQYRCNMSQSTTDSCKNCFGLK
jgi:hypothetical protein